MVEDDPYGLLAFDGCPPLPVAAHLDGLRGAHRSRAAAFTAAVDAELDTAVTRSTPTGGMFCWPEFPGGTDTDAPLARALDHGVAFVAGGAFAVDVSRASAARCCFVSYPEPVLRDAVRRLAAAAT
ncbi:hypothetical protein [Pseudonocardia sp. H11422]|uniref:hypothetical protein n=1 Tax=Pseudonocardia sp. H11422 TaxID=2835866 RepID=UPI0020290963|nr:hypothetical protein [Pseudonocardia sp. H11422]